MQGLEEKLAELRNRKEGEANLISELLANIHRDLKLPDVLFGNLGRSNSISTTKVKHWVD